MSAYFDEKIDIHQIFPAAYCDKNPDDLDLGRLGLSSGVVNCIVNKTPLDFRTNRTIGGNAPSVYLEKLGGDTGIAAARMDDILRSHVIDAAALRDDDFAAFFRAREAALLDRIENAMGKPVDRQVTADEPDSEEGDEVDEENDQ